MEALSSLLAPSNRDNGSGSGSGSEYELDMSDKWGEGDGFEDAVAGRE